MTYILTFTVVWCVFIFFVDKSQFRALYPTALLAMVMSLTSDIVTQFIPYWTYNDPDTQFPQLLILLLDDFGIYPVIAMLYAQRLPNTFKKWFPYTFFWAGIGIGLEYILATKGYYDFHHGWSISWSYLADWMIFIILTTHHRWHERTNVYCQQSCNVNVFANMFQRRLFPLRKTHAFEEIKKSYPVHIYRAPEMESIEPFYWILDPGFSFPNHLHIGYEIHYVLKGTVKIMVKEKERVLKRGQMICFSSTQCYAFTNIGLIPAKIGTIVFGAVQDLHWMQQNCK